MLRYLSIRDFVIVEALDLAFEPGFTVLTGETGAGKSILIDALALALGGRGDALAVRQGARQAEISADFDPPDELLAWLAQHGLETEEGGCILRRAIDAGGRSRAYINGRGATLAQLREAGEFLLDIHGQHAHQSLGKADMQRSLLDGHAGLADQAGAVREAFGRLRTLTQMLDDARENAQKIEEERERLAWQLEEFDRLAPQAGEWDEVQRVHTRLAHAASLMEGVESAIVVLAEGDGAVESMLATVTARLQALCDYDPALRNVLDALEPARIQVHEAARELGQYLRRAELDPESLARASARVEALHTAGRKFRVAPAELHLEHARLEARRDALRLAADSAVLSAEVEAARAAYVGLARQLSTARAKAAKKLAREVTDAMQGLAMAGGRFDIGLEKLEEGGAHGLERIEFRVAGHTGLEPRALAKVASGGELARIALAIQVITSRAARVPTLIFDEVDSGIGGAVAEMVGRLLKTLGRERQVLCVTHLAQVASQGDHHWQVAKAEAGGSVTSRVTPLADGSRVEEVARMLGGTEITSTTRKAAREMLAA